MLKYETRKLFDTFVASAMGQMYEDFFLPLVSEVTGVLHNMVRLTHETNTNDINKLVSMMDLWNVSLSLNSFIVAGT